MVAAPSSTPVRPPRVLVQGPAGPTGAYLLRIRVREALRLSFGRFRSGKPIRVPAGEYLYVGSALGRGATSLACRLLRHATRTGAKAPHAIRDEMLAAFPTLVLSTGAMRAPVGKRLFWNIDHLLDREEAEIVGVLIFPSEARQEPQLARLLQRDPCVSIIERGLGAADCPGSTHLFRLEADETWWRRLPDRLGFLP